MGRALLLLMLLPWCGTQAQPPPVNLLWSAFLPYGGTNIEIAPARLSVDADTISWMLEDENTQWTTWDGVVRQYDGNGLPLTGYWPLEGTGCNATLDHPIDFVFRNDSMWGLSTHQPLSGDILFCANAPGGGYAPDNSLNGFMLSDGAEDLLVASNAWYISAWHQVSMAQTDGRVIALDLGNTVLWDTPLPATTYHPIHCLASKGSDSLGVAGFPDIYWLGTANGTVLGTTQLYTGPEARGRLLRTADGLYWAASDAGVLRFGKLDNTLSPVWSGTTTVHTVNAIAVDAQDRLWIGGNDLAGGMLTRIDANGAVAGSWSFGDSVTDVVFWNGRLSWTGRFTPGQPDCYLLTGTPQP